MLFVTNKSKSLKDIIFSQHEFLEADELNILTGYIGPSVIEELRKIELEVKIIYGLAREKKLNKAFYEDLCALSSGNTQIYCPERLSHAKIYIWKNKGRVVFALNGSANFSISGLESPFKEVLSAVRKDSFKEFKGYYDLIFESSVEINEVSLDKFGSRDHKLSNKRSVRSEAQSLDPNICITNSLFAKASKINWGHGYAKNLLRDAYIPIRKQDIVNYPQFFPEKADNKGLGYNENAPIEILWDDGTRMEALLEGSSIIDGLRYPNKISSFKSKKIMGDYLRRRMGLTEGKFVTRQMFENYGRDNISISLLGEGVYFMDFSV